MRVNTFYAILLLSVMGGLAGCQNHNSSSLPLDDVTQLRIIVPVEGYYQITRKELEENGLKFRDPDQIQLQYQGEPYSYWLNAEPASNDLAIRFYSPPILPDINLSENVFILSASKKESTNRITPQKALPTQSNFKNNSTGTYREKYEQQSLDLPHVSGDDHWLWTLLQPNQAIEQRIQLPQEPLDHVRVRFQVWVSATNIANPIQLFSASINDHGLEPVQVEGQGWQEIEFHLDPAYVTQKNNFSIQPITFPDDLPAKIYLDWIEIEYSLPVNLGNQVQLFAVLDNHLLTTTDSALGTLVAVDENSQILEVYTLQSGHQFTFAFPPATTYAWVPDDQFLPV